MLLSSEKIGTLILGFCLVSLGLFICIETLGMSAGPSYAAVGPRVFPGLIGFGLVLSGVFQLWNSRSQLVAAEEELAYDWVAVIGVMAVFAAQILLLEWLGWIPTAVFLFMGVSLFFGSRSFFKTFVIGLILATVTFATFNYALGLNLPVGSLVEAVSQK